MRNIYPEERTLVCKDEINIYIASRIKEECIEEYGMLLQELSQKARMLVILKNVKEEQFFFDVLVQDTIFSIGYFFNSGKFFITRVQKNQANAYIQFLKVGILIYFKKIQINLGENLGVIRSDVIEKVNAPNVKIIALSQLLQMLKSYSNPDNKEIEEEKPLIGENLTRLLNLASIYNKYEKQKGEQQCNIMPLNYTKIETQAEEENTYLFYVGNTKEYKEESYVEILDKDNQKTDINGQILRIEPINKFQSRVAVQFLKQTDYKQIPKEGRIRLIYNDVQNVVREKVIQNIKKGTIPAQYLYQTLEDFSYLPWKEMDFTKLEESMQKEKYPLNPSQVKAVEKGISAQDLSLILGPPGTGKTTVIAWWVKYFLKQNKRVLISSQNNSAVDNVIERIGKEYKNIIRIGDGKKIAENVKEFLYTNKLAEFKKQILAVTEKNLLKEEHILAQKQEKYKEYQELKELIDNFSKQEEKIQEKKEKLKQEIKNSKTFYQKYQKYEKQKNEMENKLDEKGKKQNILIQFFTKIKNKWDRVHYENIVNNRAKQIQKYNQSRQNLNQLLKDKEFIADVKQFGQYQKKMKEIPKEKLQNISQKKKQLHDEIKNIKEIVDALKDWNNHIQERNDVLTAILLETVQVVGATCIGIQSRKLFADTTFDVAIVDEAGQIQIHNVLVPMSRAQKSILLRRS